MFILKAENRNMGLKPKQLRRTGAVPGILYGKNLEEPLSIQFTLGDAVRFLKSHSRGSKVELALGDKKFTALFREVSYTPATDEIEHLDFQTLPAGEVVTSVARIVLVNSDMVQGLIQQPLAEISYRALPSDLIDRIEIDLDGKGVGDSLRISDLDIVDNPKIEILSPIDSMVYSVVDNRKLSDAEETENESTESAEE